MSEKQGPVLKVRERGIRLTAMAPLLFSLVGSIITFLTLISETSPGMLEGAHSMTVNQSTRASDAVAHLP